MMSSDSSADVVGPVAVIGDGEFYVFRTANAALSRLGAFELWAAVDANGRRLILSGGWHREWMLGGVRLDADHGRRLATTLSDPPDPQLLDALKKSIETCGHSATSEMPVGEMIERVAQTHG